MTQRAWGLLGAVIGAGIGKLIEARTHHPLGVIPTGCLCGLFAGLVVWRFHRPSR